MIIFVGNGYVGYFCGMILNIRRMKKISLIGLVVLAIFIAKSAQREEVVSELMMRNVEALADKSEIDNGGVGGIVCSAKCNDGIGRCWIYTGKTCIFSGYMVNMCSNLPCVSSSDGPI